jgi:hypothetical protein
VPDHKRVYKKKPNSATFTEAMYFYVGDQKLATTTPQMEVPQGGDTPVLIGFTNTKIHLWFGSKKLAGRDRLGSDLTSQKRFFPYGGETTSTANDKDKFATCDRDQADPHLGRR